MSKFVPPPVDWQAVTFPIEGETNNGQKVILHMVGPKSGDLFGEHFDGVLRGTTQEFWSSCVWYPSGVMHDVGQSDSDSDLKLSTFGKLPRKSA